MFGIMLLEVLGLVLAIGGMAIGSNYIDIADYLHTVLCNMGLMTKGGTSLNLIDGTRVMLQVGRELSWLRSCLCYTAEFMIIIGLIMIFVSVVMSRHRAIRPVISDEHEMYN